MTKEQYINLSLAVEEAGYADEIAWAREIKPCDNSTDFAMEAIWVILNSGMKEQIARKIADRIYEAMQAGRDISEVFGHKGKVAAIKYVRQNSSELFYSYLSADDKLTFLKTIPFIGEITCYHLAKNLGHDCVKPDRHLVRIADQYETTPDDLCERLSKETGERKAAIDTVIWRACNLGIDKTILFT